MAITINQHRALIGNYHHDKMEVNAKQCNKKASHKAYNKVQEITFTLNIKNIAPSYHTCQHRGRRLQLKQIICFMLLLNHVRGHTVLTGENLDIPPPPLALKKYNQTLPFLNIRLPIKTKITTNRQQCTDDNEKKTAGKPEKRPIQ
ncbi:hypothetical protein J5069_01315 [Candidatus Symbiopectobacterium sp. NZEC127]|uniref:hypothetical protein n=1 Tax=Candidatus Symbiopectobacterium sp. NZEC127 TaxID=2820472 RepID=UPI002226BF85|nr:hypothetical protein [Candidatus Symbiopectobacterium sp. NZEC127]MCW2484525.1 hypothetical protein [Candidatus Symbiopectobacterium sp. NZEC127]